MNEEDKRMQEIKRALAKFPEWIEEKRRRYFERKAFREKTFGKIVKQIRAMQQN